MKVQIMKKLNEKALLKADEATRNKTIIRKINQIVDAINIGVVHDNKVKAERELINAVNEVYESLPTSVTEDN